jgi:hypothetical protein
MSVNLDTITHVCICGSHTWKILATFDDYEIASYSTDMYCGECGAYAIAPTPIDKPGYDPDNYVTS